VFAHVGFVQAHILGQSLLPGKAMVVLPRVAQEHGEGELVSGAEIFRFKQEIRDLGKAAASCDIGTLEDDIFSFFENVANGARAIEPL